MVPAPAPPSTAAGGGKSETGNNEYAEALDRLQPLQPILWGFNHRNRNQHRRAAWWGAFGMLRRRVDKLVEELLDAASKSKSSSSKSKKRKHAGDGEEHGDHPAAIEVRDHVRWLRDVLVPKCYLAFSQLTADNQFATLGVVLLGALAQVNAACTQLIGEAAATKEEEDISSVTSKPTGTISTKEVGNSGPRDPSFGDDFPKAPEQKGGKVISRDEVARAEKLRRKKQKLEGDASQPEPSNIPYRTGDRNLDGDAASAEDQQDTSSKVKAKEVKNTTSKEAVKTTKKKRVKKGGDEFDDLFKGLF